MCSFDGCGPSAPTVSGASSISNSDGTVTVTITGTGFVDGMTVFVNANPCTDVRVLTSTTLTCRLPNGQIALVNVVVIAPGGGTSPALNLSSPIISYTATSTAVTPNVISDSWSNQNNALANDGVVAETVVTSGGETSTLFIMGFFGSAAYTLPATVVIDGIVAKCRWKSGGVGAGIATDHKVYLAKSGLQVGSNKANGSVLPTTLTYSSNYGAINDLWGAAWTPADINHSGFGIVLSFIEDDTSYSVDNCQLSVYFH